MNSHGNIMKRFLSGTLTVLLMLAASHSVAGAMPGPYASEACAAAEVTRGVPLPRSKPRAPEYVADLCISGSMGTEALALPQDSLVLVGSRIFVRVKAFAMGTLSLIHEDSSSGGPLVMWRHDLERNELRNWISSDLLEFEGPTTTARITIRFETPQVTRETTYQVKVLNPADTPMAASPMQQERAERAILSLPALAQEFTSLHAPPTKLRGSGTSIFRNSAPTVVWIKTSDGNGSGSIISHTGEIITNQHVVGRDKQVEVHLYGEGAESCDSLKSYVADVIKVDYRRDLALIQLRDAPKAIEAIPFGIAGSIRVGDDVHVIGSPLGECWSYSRGYVSQVRSSYSWRDRNADVIQTQAPISPGNSGGPLLSNSGRLIGVNSFQSTGGQNLNYAVSIREVISFLDAPLSVACDPWEAKSWKEQDSCIGAPADKEAATEELSFGRGGVTQDSDANGIPERMVREVDVGGRTQLIVLEDTNQDEKWDRIGYDTDGDGKFDYWLTI
jgi:S1-C subfamily serine protease